MTPAPWDAGASFPEGSPPPEAVQVAVVGAGPSALAVSGALARGGVRVALVPPVPWASAQVAAGPGLALPTPGRHYWDLCRSLGREAAREHWGLAASGAARLRTLLSGVPCGLERGGLLLLAAEEAEHREMVEGLLALTEDGFAPRMMGPSAATGYLPVDSDFHALYLAGAAAFDPLEALAALAREAQGAGVLFLAPDPGVTWAGAEGVELRGEAFRLRAETLVLAEGAPLLGELPGLGRFEAEVVTTGPLREGMRGSTVAASAARGREVYRSGPGGGLLGWGPPADPTLEEAEPPVRLRFPEARRAALTGRWTALYEETADRLPVLGALPGRPRVQVLAGFGVQPWSLGWAAGEALAEALLGRGEGMAWARPDRPGLGAP